MITCINTVAVTLVNFMAPAHILLDEAIVGTRKIHPMDVNKHIIMGGTYSLESQSEIKIIVMFGDIEISSYTLYNEYVCKEQDKRWIGDIDIHNEKEYIVVATTFENRYEIKKFHIPHDNDFTISLICSCDKASTDNLISLVTFVI